MRRSQSWATASHVHLRLEVRDAKGVVPSGRERGVGGWLSREERGGVGWLGG